MAGEGFLTYPLRDGWHLFRCLLVYEETCRLAFPAAYLWRPGRTGCDLIGTWRTQALQCFVRPARSTVLANRPIDRNEYA